MYILQVLYRYEDEWDWEYEFDVSATTKEEAIQRANDTYYFTETEINILMFGDTVIREDPIDGCLQSFELFWR